MSAPSTPRHAASDQSRPRVHLRPGQQSAPVVVRRASLLRFANRSGTAPRAVHVPHLVSRHANRAAPWRRAAHSSRATEQQVPRCSQSPKTSVESWNPATQAAVPLTESALLSPPSSIRRAVDKRSHQAQQLPPSTPRVIPAAAAQSPPRTRRAALA